MAEPTISPFRATQHETLVLKLEALLHELRPLALRHPEAAVPAPLATLAEALLFDARPFTTRRKREALPAAAPEFSGLVVQLGQALATLAAFEVRHTTWSTKLAAYVWRLGSAHDAPVARLRPQLAVALQDDKRDGARLRSKLTRLIDAKVSDAYERGFVDGGGRPIDPYEGRSGGAKKSTSGWPIEPSGDRLDRAEKNTNGQPVDPYEARPVGAERSSHRRA